MGGSDFMKKRMITLAALFTAGVLFAVTPVLAAEGTDAGSNSTATGERLDDWEPPGTEIFAEYPLWMEINGEKYLYIGYRVLEDYSAEDILCPNTWAKDTLNHRTYWFYSDENGKRLKNCWVFYNNQWFYLLEEGQMATGWAFVSNHWYYFNENGDMATGWIFVNGKWYYLNENGDMATGWQYLDGKWYYLNGNGDMATGWILLDGDWYYLKDSGAMACRETLRIDGTRYSFDRSGIWYQ